MPEFDIFSMVTLFRTYAVGLCLGCSTMVLTFYFFLVSKGSTEPAEGRMLHITFTVLRVGMALALLSELSALYYHYSQGNASYWAAGSFLSIRLTIYSVIVINAIAMQKRLVSMWLGPVFAGGSWYAYFFFSVWPQYSSSYATLLSYYLTWLFLFGGLLTVLRLYLTRNQQSRLGDGADNKMAR